MDFALPEHLPGLLAEMDAFIEAEIKPLEAENMQYFDQRREYARTDWENDGIPQRAWEDLLDEMRRRADAAGWLRYGLPSRFGGRDGTNLDMAVIREHLAHKGLGLHNDLQDESSIVGNFPQVIMMDRFGTDAQKKEWGEALLTGERSMAFGLSEPGHGSDATWLETTAVADGDGWVINGTKRWNTGVHRATHDLVFARTSGEAGQATRHHRVPGALRHAGFHGAVLLVDVQHAHRPRRGGTRRTSGCPPTPCSARWTTASRSARPSCTRTGFGRPPAASARRSTASTGPRSYAGRAGGVRQAAVGEPGRAVAARRTADRGADGARCWSTTRPGTWTATTTWRCRDKVSMANYRANRLVCEAADRAMQVHGGLGYSRHEPFEHIYRHHRRYRITEGAEEIQIRRVAQRMFKFGRKSREEPKNPA